MARSFVFYTMRTNYPNYLTANLLFPAHITCLIYVSKTKLILGSKQVHTDSGNERCGLLLSWRWIRDLGHFGRITYELRSTAGEIWDFSVGDD